MRSRAARAARVGAAGALAVLALALAATPAEAKRDMRCNGAALLCKRHFDRVVLPGAHNAMSAASLGWRIPNQSVAIPDQLETGVRALLIDTHYGRLQPDGTVKTDDDGRVTDRRARPLPLPRRLRDRRDAPGAGPALDPQVRAQAPQQRARDRRRAQGQRRRLRRRDAAERAARLRLRRRVRALADPEADDPHPAAGGDARRARRRHDLPVVPRRLRRDPPGDAVHVRPPGRAHGLGQLAGDLRTRTVATASARCS